MSRFAVAAVVLTLATAPLIRAEEPAWITKSNTNAQVLLDMMAKQAPEFAGRIGVRGYDDKTVDLTAGIEERTRTMLTAARDELSKRLLVESDPQVRQDLEILIKGASDRLETDALTEKYMLTYVDVPQIVFFGEFSLLDDQIEAGRRPASI